MSITEEDLHHHQSAKGGLTSLARLCWRTRGESGPLPGAGTWVWSTRPRSCVRSAGPVGAGRPTPHYQRGCADPPVPPPLARRTSDKPGRHVILCLVGGVRDTHSTSSPYEIGTWSKETGTEGSWRGKECSQIIWRPSGCKISTADLIQNMQIKGKNRCSQCNCCFKVPHIDRH